MFDPNDQARIIANRANLKTIVDAQKSEYGKSMLMAIHSKLTAELKKRTTELVFDYYLSNDQEVQKSLDKYELFEKSLAEVKADLIALGIDVDKKDECNDCGKDHDHTTVEVHSVTAAELLRKLFNI
jgi:hypothetical protein